MQHTWIRLLFLATFICSSTIDAKEFRVSNDFLGISTTPAASALVRQRGVSEAWKAEVELVRKTGIGTHLWNADQRSELLLTGRVKGFEGHHINSATRYPALAGNGNNIKFVKGRIAHLQEHHGSFRNPTAGKLIMRQELIKDYYRSVSTKNIALGSAFLLSGGYLIFENFPDIFRNYELAFGDGPINEEAFLIGTQKVLGSGAGVAFLGAGAARLTARQISVKKLNTTAIVRSRFAGFGRIAGSVGTVLLVSKSAVNAYRWNQGYIPSPDFIKDTSVVAAGVAGGAAGTVAGSMIGKNIDATYGELVGGLVGGAVGAIIASAAVSAGFDESYAQRDFEAQNAYLDHMYQHYSVDRKFRYAELSEEDDSATN